MPMDKAEFRRFFVKFVSDAETILFQKIDDYARPEDQLENFEGEAKLLGLSPMQVHGVYMNKHVRAINAFARNNTVASEPIRHRFIDLFNFAILGAALAQTRLPQPVPAKRK